MATKTDLIDLANKLKAQKKWLLIGVGILVLVLLITLFFTRNKVDSGKYDELGKAYNQLLDMKAAERKGYEEQINLYRDSLNMESDQKDYYKNLANKNYQFYKDNEKKFRNIPSSVKPITDKDSLRAAGKIIR